MLRYAITPETGILPPKDKSLIKVIEIDGAITAMALDPHGEEVMLGSNKGSLYYGILKQDMIVRLISRVTPSAESINSIQFDTSNPHVLLTTCGSESSDIKLFTKDTLD